MLTLLTSTHVEGPLLPLKYVGGNRIYQDGSGQMLAIPILILGQVGSVSDDGGHNALQSIVRVLGHFDDLFHFSAAADHYIDGFSIFAKGRL